jgi:cyclic pyranopterin phosphate synthase
MIKFGYYGQDDVYDSYVARRGAWRKFEAGIFAARARYGSLLGLHLAYVLSTKTSALSKLRKARAFAEAHSMKFHVDLIHYSLPYFTEGTDRVLQFTDRDRSAVDRVVVELKTLKRERPDLYEESDASIHSIPDWLLKGPGMRVPCDAYNMIWVGADGSVRLCYVDFPLGNLHERGLSEMLFYDAHRDACRGALQLSCPNCHCGRDTRIRKHFPSLLRYSRSPRFTVAAAEDVSEAAAPFKIVQ